MMFHLIVTACLAAAPSDCAGLLLPAGDRDSEVACMGAADGIAEGWFAARPELVGQGRDCVATVDLPALSLAEIAPGVFVHEGEPVQMEDSADGRIANLGVVIGDASVAVIDAGVSRAEGQALYAAIRRLTDKPISHVILTHMHPDHVLGASVFHEAGARIVGHHALPLALETRAGTYLANVARLYPPAEVLGTEVALPDEVVQGRARLDLGGRVLDLQVVPTAHTDNDLTVWDATSGTLFTGDLLFRKLTPVVDGSLLGWLDWMATAPWPAPRIVVPGHGPVAQDWEMALAPQRGLLQALADAVRAALAQGAAMSAAVPQVVAAMAPYAAGWNSFEANIARDATAAYAELEWE